MNTIQQAVSFDIWNTLLKSNGDYKKSKLTRMINFFNLDPGGFDRFKKIYKEADDRLDRFGDLTGTQYGFKERLEEIAGDINAVLDEDTIAPLQQEINDSFVADSPFLIEEKTPSILKAIKETGAKVYVMSNTGFIDGHVMRRVLEKLGITEYLDGALFSNEVGCSKPNPQIFKRLIEIHKGTNIIHVGDNYLADYEGAVKAGIKALLLCDEKKGKIIKETYDVPDLKYIRAIGEVLTFLD